MGLFSISAGALTKIHGVHPHHSQWAYDSSAVVCSLRQDIPQYGHAQFEQRAGKPMTLSLTTQLVPRKPGQLSLNIAPPSWRLHKQNLSRIVDLSYKKGAVPVTIKERYARRALQALQDGNYITFEYIDWLDGQTPVTVLLSTVNFRDASSHFLQCVADLLPGTFAELRRTAIYFASDSARLGAKDQQRLTALATFIKADTKVERVVISGHADISGEPEYNDKLARRRADSVTEYLVEKGIARERLRVQSFGANLPYASNDSAKGRLNNRRVVIELIQ